MWEQCVYQALHWDRNAKMTDREHVQELIFRSGCCWGNNRVPFGSSVLLIKGILKQTQQVTFIRDYEDRQQTGKFLIMAAAQRRGTSKEEAMSFQVSFLEIQQIQQWQWWVVSEENYLEQNVQALSNTQKKKDSFNKTITHFLSQKLGKFIANSTIIDGGISARVCNSAGGRGFQKGSQFISQANSYCSASPTMSSGEIDFLM